MVESATSARLAGAVVGNYQLRQVLQEHPWGPIFLARNREGRNMMLRLLIFPRGNKTTRQEPSPEDHMIYLGRFRQEANQIAKLRHPHILPLLDYGNFQGTAFLVYPYISLVTLRSLLVRGAPSDLRVIGLYLEQIISALEYAHERAVLHRNLSTNNIYLYNNHHLLLGEFGLLRMRELGLQARGQSQIFEGDSESSAPEQIPGRSADIHTDIYALGALLFRLLTGQAPFQGRSRDEIMRQHLYMEVPSPRMWRSTIPEGLDAILLKAMAKEPQMRFRHPSEVLQAYYQIVAPERLPVVAELIQNAIQITDRPLTSEPSTERSTALAKSPRSAYRRINHSATSTGSISRRTLLKAGGGTAAAAAAIVAVGASLLSAHNAWQPGMANSTSPTPGTAQATMTDTKPTQATTPQQQSGPLLARTTEVPINSAKTFPLADQKNPGVLVHLPGNTFVAYDTTCTHEGCAVYYNTATMHLECPCHDAVFDPANNATVLQGPAKMPLKRLHIAVHSDGTITMA